MMPNDTKQHGTMPPNHFQLVRFKRPQLTAGHAPLLLKAAVVAASDDVPRERTTNEQSSEPQLNLKGVRRLGSLRTIITAGISFAPPPSPRRLCAECQATTGLRQTETHCPRCRLTSRLDELIGENKLSAKVWERVRRACCLPKKTDKIPFDKARAAHQMLNLFVSRVSFGEQTGLSGGDLAERLLALPDLPPVFVKSLRGQINSDRRNNAPEGSDGDKKISSADGEVHQENSVAASAAKRKPISAARFAEVAARQGSFCYWCGIRVVREAQIPPTNRMLKNGSTILYYVGDELREEAVGTVDHLLRVTDGGGNSVANLVISCYPCNRERERITAAYGRPFARRRVPCHHCGGRFFHPDWGCCSICGAVPERARKFTGWFGYLIELMKRWFRVI